MMPIAEGVPDLGALGPWIALCFAIVSITTIVVKAMGRGQGMELEQQPEQQQKPQEQAEIHEKLGRIESALDETKDTVARLDERQKNHDRELTRFEQQLRELVASFRQEISRLEHVFRKQQNP
jgi:peptidoglycan hydrolase CwlO-like protein